MEALTIRQSVVVNASQQRVWEAITTPEQLSAWFGSTFRFDKLAVGEPMHFIHEEKIISSDLVITEVEPIERFAFKWPAELGYPILTQVTFTLEPVAGGTRVTVTDSGYEALPEDVARRRFEQNADGWRIQLEEHLPAYLARLEEV